MCGNTKRKRQKMIAQTKMQAETIEFAEKNDSEENAVARTFQATFLRTNPAMFRYRQIF